MRQVDDLLFDVAHAAHQVAEFTKGMDRTAYDADAKTQAAVLHELMIIGEATKMVPETWRSQHPAIPWRNMSRMRDRLIHNYFAVNHNIVWEVVTVEIPILSAYLQPFVTALLADSEEE